MRAQAVDAAQPGAAGCPPAAAPSSPDDAPVVRPTLDVPVSRILPGRATLCDSMGNGESTEGPGAAPGPDIRRAREADHPIIVAMLGALELGYPAVDLSCFWVAESRSSVVAIAELKQLGSCALLSCVGVREDLQGRGIGQALVQRVVRETPLPVYLYTLVPGFFRKAGFRDAGTLPPDLPPRSLYGCVGCDPSACVCMVRVRDGA